MKLKLLLVFALLIGVFANVSAVTDGEMEQARAITAKNYLRYVNNGSGYLDDVKGLPKSVAELKKVLKAKELENLKKFEAVQTPKDYASWDKAKLVAYWSETFLASPGLDPAGKASHTRTAKHINQLTVSAPSKEAPKAEEKPAAPAEEPVAETPKADEQPAPAADATADEIAGQMAAAETAVVEEVAAEEAEAPRPKKSNSTWIYVGILIFLVVVVVGLVIYAARAMKGDGEDKDDSDEIGEGSSSSAASKKETSDTPAYVPSDSVSRKEHEFMIERKNEKIRKVKAELDVVREENARLQAAQDALQTRLSQAQTQIESLRIALAEAENKGGSPAPAAGSPAPQPQRPTRSLYLGRVNRNGLFVRADRQMNPDATVYRLDTEDGYTGTFRVVNTPAVVERALDNPAQWLEEGCAIDDTITADDANEILTESSGTAVLENGCWKMIRKAKVRYN